MSTTTIQNHNKFSIMNIKEITCILTNERPFLNQLIRVQTPSFLLISHNLQSNRNSSLGHPIITLQPARTSRSAFASNILQPIQARTGALGFKLPAIFTIAAKYTADPIIDQIHRFAFDMARLGIGN